MSDQDPFDDFDIPKVDLREYLFSPPGSMGWSAAEYERLLNHPDEQTPSEPFSPPPVPAVALAEMAGSPDHQVDDSSAVPESAVKRAETPVDQRQKKPDPGKTKKTERSKTESEERIKEFIFDPNPPAKPWMAESLVTFYIHKSREKADIG